MTSAEVRPLPPLELDRFLALFAGKTGMVFPERKKERLARDLARAAGRAGFEDPGAFRSHLESLPTDHPVWQGVIEILRVGETYFFRDDSQFSALSEQVIPEILSRRRDSRRIRVWSAGCATGEEPYSLAILLLENLPDAGEWDVSVLATDIHARGLETARRGVYRKWSFRKTPERLMNRYFIRQGEDYEVQERVRRLVRFCPFNMVDDRQPLPVEDPGQGLDLVLWRNMAIYFHPEAVARVARRLTGALAEGGWLLVSPAEAGSFSVECGVVCALPGAAVYRKEKAEKPATAGLPALHPAGPLLLAEQAPRFPVAVSGPGPERAVFGPESSILVPKTSVSGPDSAEAGSRALEQGLDRLRKGNYEEAVNLLFRVERDHPRKAEALGKAALALANLGRLPEAERACGQALSQDPLLAEARYVQALVLLEQGREAEARDGLKKTLYLAPDFVLAHWTLADLARRGGLAEEAARHRERALSLARNLDPGQELCGSVSLTAGRLLALAGENGAGACAGGAR